MERDIDIDERMNDYEAEVTVTTKTLCRTRATNYTGAHKLFNAGQCEQVQVIETKRTYENVRLIEKGED